MALITCPECGKEVSDKVASCPHCGYPIKPESEVATPHTKKEIPIKAIIAGVCALAIVIVGITIFLVQDKAAKEKAAAEAAAQARKDYIANLEKLCLEAISGGAEAEGLCNLTYKVWYNTIYEKNDSETDEYTKSKYGFHSDFNTSLSNLYKSSKTKDIILKIDVSRATMDRLMSELQNPPEGLDACYKTADDLYDSFCDLTKLAKSPSGSLQTYAANFGSYDDELLKNYNKLEALIPEE